jgi:two-component system cell cycle response regulator
MNTPDISKINEGITRKFRKIETDLAVCKSAVELFEALLGDIQTEFGIPFVWLSLIRIPEMAGLQKSLEASPLLHDRLNIIENAPFLEVVPDGASPILISGDLRPFFRLLPPNRKYFIRSLAVSPLTLHGRLIGSLNQGDSSLERYDPGMDATLLMHLAQSVSDCLSHLLPSEEQSHRPGPVRG